MKFQDYTIKAAMLVTGMGKKTSKINEAASGVKYQQICEGALSSRFPGARVLVKRFYSKRQLSVPFALMPVVINKNHQQVIELGQIAATICETVRQNCDCWLVRGK